MKGQRDMSIRKYTFGRLPDGTAVDIFTLQNAYGMTAQVMTYGAVLVSLKAPDRNGHSRDVTLGFDTLDGYLDQSPYFGAIVGRYGNRIAKGRFQLDGREYHLAANDGENHLHGGIRGFDKVIWKAVPFMDLGSPSLKLTYLSWDGEEGYPGNLNCTVVYSLTAANELKISYEAETDQATPVNLTHHSYINLAGQGNGDILVMS